MSDAALKLAAQLLGPDGDFAMGMVPFGPNNKVRGFVKGTQTLPQYYQKWISKHGNKTFIVFQNERLTFLEFEETVAAIAWELKNTMNVQVGDRVAICMRNFPEWALLFVAVTAIGGVIVPLNSWWKASELAYGLKDCGAKVVFCDEERLERIGASGVSVEKLILCRGKSSSHPSFDAVLAHGRAHNPSKTVPYVTDPSIVRPEMIAMIMYTSGTTTGNPKGVMLSHRSVCAQMLSTEFFLTMRDKLTAMAGIKPPASPIQPCAICPIPLFHVTGSHHIFLASFIEGRKLVMMAKWDAGEALRLIEREKATSWTGVPTMVQDLMEHPDFAKTDTSSLVAVGGGGAPTPPSQVSRVGKKFRNARPSQGYGLTETNGAVCIITADDYESKPRSTGRPYPIAEVRIVDLDTGESIDPGSDKAGEVQVKSSLVMSGYWNQPKATSEVLDDQGWFHTGDVGKIDADGFVYIVDRAKDIVIRGGENISCSEVEAAFYHHPAIMECAAYGIPHERLGEEVALCVHFKPGMQATAQELLAVAKPLLAHFKVPRLECVVFTNDPLPRGPTGKTLKRELRKTHAQAMIPKSRL